MFVYKGHLMKRVAIYDIYISINLIFYIIIVAYIIAS